MLLPKNLSVPNSPNTIVHRRSNSNLSEKAPSYKINLENLVAIENKLTTIFDGFRNGENVSLLCNDYWSLTEESYMAHVDKIFRDDKTKKIAKTSTLLEIISIVFLNFSASESALVGLRNIVNYLH